MEIIEKIKFHQGNKKYCKIRRSVGENTFEKSSGYIVDFSENFVLLQETDDFIIRGYLIIPFQSISEVICSVSDKYYDKIMKAEGITAKVGNKYKIELKSWKTIFDSIQKLDFNVIVQNEKPNNEDFNIGPITKITEEAVYIQYFDPKCYIDSESTKIDFSEITIASFDDIYINTLSKYLRKRKPKKDN